MKAASLWASALVLVLGLAGAGQARAGIMQYTLSGGGIFGTLNGVSFNNANFTITATADPANITTGSVGGGPYPFQQLAATSTIMIDGFAPTTFTDASFGVVAYDASKISAGFAFAGFGFASDATPGFWAAGKSGPPNLAGAFNFSGSSDVSSYSYGTAAGILTITGGDTLQNLTFTAAAVPEPGTMVLAGLVCGMGGVIYRRRAARPVVA